MNDKLTKEEIEKARVEHIQSTKKKRILEVQRELIEKGGATIPIYEVAIAGHFRDIGCTVICTKEGRWSEGCYDITLAT